MATKLWVPVREGLTSLKEDDASSPPDMGPERGSPGIHLSHLSMATYGFEMPCKGCRQLIECL